MAIVIMNMIKKNTSLLGLNLHPTINPLLLTINLHKTTTQISIALLLTINLHTATTKIFLF